MNDPKADAAYHPGLCSCFPFDYSPARPVYHLREVEVIDPACRHHGDRP
jgi:hypothetical protein